MSVAIAWGAFAAVGPESRNGSGSSSHQRSFTDVARSVAIAAVPIVLAGAVAAGARRRSTEHGTSTAGPAAGLSAIAAQAAGKVAPARAKRYRPKNFVRYYGLSVLISALERESTRKAIITTLKWVQKRS